MSEPVFVEVITFECTGAVELPSHCPKCSARVTRFEVLVPATARVTLDADTFDAVDSEDADYDGIESVHLVRCQYCGCRLSKAAEIEGAGAVTSWHVRCLASYLHAAQDLRAFDRLRADLELGPHVDGAWEQALLENSIRASK